MFNSSSLSSLSSFPLTSEFSPRHVETILVIDSLWSCRSVQGGIATNAYIAAMPAMARLKIRNALKEQIDLCNRADWRSSLVSIWLSFCEV